jgi:hypothetical protein
MSRKSSRVMFSAVVLIASLVVLPAAATGTAHRVPTHQVSLWSVFWDWAASLWARVSPGEDVPDRTVVEASTSSPTNDSDRGALIDPNGSPH